MEIVLRSSGNKIISRKKYPILNEIAVKLDRNGLMGKVAIVNSPDLDALDREGF